MSKKVILELSNSHHSEIGLLLNDYRLIKVDGYYFWTTSLYDITKYKFRSVSVAKARVALITWLEVELTYAYAARTVDYFLLPFDIQQTIKKRIEEAENDFKLSDWNKFRQDGGFTWSRTKEGKSVWSEVITYNNYKSYYNLHVKKDITTDIDSKLINLNL